jgi:hypothetical protein
MDYTLTQDGRGLVAHRPDCPVARLLADAGKPVLTLFGAKPIPKNTSLRVEYHDCLKR